MSLKAKLISTISAMCLVIALVSVGVWAASTATVNLSGTLTFTANDVYCTVAGTFDGDADGIADPATLTWDSTATSSTEPTTGDETTWAGKALKFDDKGTAITFTITVTNKSTERGIKIVLSQSKVPTGVNTSVTYNSSNYTLGSTQILAKSTSSESLNSVDIVITFSLKDTNLDTTVSGAEWAFALSLTDATVTA